MSEINIATSPRTEITIQGQLLSVPQPFAEGHVLRANEAAVLNQTYAENVRNNFASSVKKIIDEATAAGAEPDFSTLQATFDAYLQTYDFGVRRVGARAVPTDPVLKEATRLAQEAIKNALKAKGTTMKAIGKERFDELTEQLLEARPDLKDRAKQILELRASVGGDIQV